MRTIVASGELATLAPERVWQELARGLMEARPSRMLAVLRECGALAALLPEVDALFGVPQPPRASSGSRCRRARRAGARLGGRARRSACPRATRCSRTTLARRNRRRRRWPRHIAHERRSVRLAQRAVGAPARAARMPRRRALAARWHGVVHRAAELRPATLLDLLSAADALRRPERLDTLLAACAADACSRPGARAGLSAGRAPARRARRRSRRSMPARSRARSRPAQRQEGDDAIATPCAARG